MNAIDPIFLTTTFIETLEAGKVKASATGFFFEHNGRLFLVTNKHVIYGKDYFDSASSPEVDKFKILVHTNMMDVSQNESMEIELFAQDRKMWLEHTDPRVDIVLIPLELDRNRYLIHSLNSIENVELGNIKIGRFEKIFVMGYPYGWFDRNLNLPITRVGHLSSPFKIPFHNMPVMLGDVETHPGMSGGPVYMELIDYTTKIGNQETRHMGRTKLVLVGVHSGQPVLGHLVNKNTGLIGVIPHNLINIWFADLITDIITQKTF